LNQRSAQSPGGLEILFLDSWLTDRPRGSGSAVAIAGLVTGLAALGHRVRTVRPRWTTPFLDLTRVLFNLGLGQRLDGLHADLLVGFDYDGCFLGRSPDRRYVVALKGVMADELSVEAGWNKARFAVLSRLEQRNARRADRVLVTSEHSRRAAVRRYDLQAEKVRIVPEGIDVDAWERMPQPRPKAGPVILSVARQYRRKNTRALLRAVALVRSEIPGVTLRVVGDGPELPTLRRLASSLGLKGNGAVFLGSLESREELQREYSSADLFCLPSRQEGFGIVLLEAMAAGLPIVAADAAAVPEVAPHGEVALLVSPDDPEALASAILSVLRDEVLRERLSLGGRRRWRRYDWPSVAERFLEAAEVPSPP
jgi:glycosyltransferase involved in cell wall biosynthesis